MYSQERMTKMHVTQVTNDQGINGWSLVASGHSIGVEDESGLIEALKTMVEVYNFSYCTFHGQYTGNHQLRDGAS